MLVHGGCKLRKLGLHLDSVCPGAHLALFWGVSFTAFTLGSRLAVTGTLGSVHDNECDTLHNMKSVTLVAQDVDIVPEVRCKSAICESFSITLKLLCLPVTGLYVDQVGMHAGVIRMRGNLGRLVTLPPSRGNSLARAHADMVQQADTPLLCKMRCAAPSAFTCPFATKTRERRGQAVHWEGLSAQSGPTLPPSMGVTFMPGQMLALSSSRKLPLLRMMRRALPLVPTFTCSTLSLSAATWPSSPLQPLLVPPSRGSLHKLQGI